MKRYTDYGSYWYALKAVLRRNDIDFGAYTDKEIEAEYSEAILKPSSKPICFVI
jgi:hypothetical protein